MAAQDHDMGVGGKQMIPDFQVFDSALNLKYLYEVKSSVTLPCFEATISALSTSLTSKSSSQSVSCTRSLISFEMDIQALCTPK